MALSKIKDEFKNKKVAYGKSRSDLGIGYRDDVDQLAIIALESGDKSLLKLFVDPMPSLYDLKAAKTDAKIAEIEAKVEIKEPKKRPPKGDTGTTGTM